MIEDVEWIETDGRGGFASGTVAGIRTRRYHGLLMAAQTPARRVMLVNGFDAWIDLDGETIPVTSHRYHPAVVHPEGYRRITSFRSDPWPTWTFRLTPELSLIRECLVRRGHPIVVVRFTLFGPGSARLHLRPLLSGREIHALHAENPRFRFEPDREQGALVTLRPYPAHPGVLSISNGRFAFDPVWYRGFRYEQEHARGLEGGEDLGSPGVYTWDLGRDASAVWLLALDEPVTRDVFSHAQLHPARLAEVIRDEERERRGRLGPLERAAESYLVRRGCWDTVIAGYPWFADWGRDTFIALRGLCLATGRFGEARRVLLGWVTKLSHGLLPNRFLDASDAPDYGSVDAALWFVLAVDAYLRDARIPEGSPERAFFEAAILRVVDDYARGAPHGISADTDGLLRAGEPGDALTWMDAKIDAAPVTPRVGKPVEVQALWINALHVASSRAYAYRARYTRALKSFEARFWNPDLDCLYDVIDVDHEAGQNDPSLRPNQIFAAGGLPLCVLPAERARRVVAVVERELWTPAGLRTLSPRDPRYVPRYEGDPAARDRAYHQGTAWPWLVGPFVDAWIHAHGGDAEARAEARRRFLAPLLAQVAAAGLGHLSEMADGDPPHKLRGCPFQAWSVAEAIRLDRAL